MQINAAVATPDGMVGGGGSHFESTNNGQNGGLGTNNNGKQNRTRVSVNGVVVSDKADDENDDSAKPVVASLRNFIKRTVVVVFGLCLNTHLKEGNRPTKRERQNTVQGTPSERGYILKKFIDINCVKPSFKME
jgi:hypothetical protein